MRGANPHLRFQRAALAKRSGQPYPATFRNLQWTAGESNPDFLLARQVSSRWTSSPKRIHAEVRPGFEPGLPPYRGGVPPQHLQTEVTPDGIEPPFPERQSGVVAVGPRGHGSSRGESRTRKIIGLSTRPLFQSLRTRLSNERNYEQVAGPGVAPGSQSL